MVSYPMGTGDSFPEVKQQGREADHPTASSAEVKNGGAINALSITINWAMLN
jgi:hypothetical protein